MNYWWTSDTHFGHANIIAHCNRPQLQEGDYDLENKQWTNDGIRNKRLEEMNNYIITRWNQRVKPGDIVYFIGDFCFKNSSPAKGNGVKVEALSWEKRLNGKIIHMKGNHDCFSEKTRLLTRGGYKHHWELSIGDMIPTINLNTKSVEYQPIEDIVVNVVNKAYTFKNKSAEGVFSVNHKHLYSLDSTKLNVGTSDHIWDLKSPVKFPCSHQSNFVDYDMSDDWIKLLAWIITDGGIGMRSKSITIYQSKVETKDRIKELLDVLNIKYKVYSRRRTTNMICGRSLKTVPKLAYEFKIGVKASDIILKKLDLVNKYKLPYWVSNLSDNQVNLFMDEVVLGDGTVCTSGTKVVYGKKCILDQLMGLCVTHNIKSNVVKDIREDYYLTIGCRNNNRRDDLKVKEVYPSKRKIIDYNDVMWCVTVPNHTLFIELNGKSLVTKNSNNSTKTNMMYSVIQYGGKNIAMVHNPEHVKKYNLSKLNIDYAFVGHIHEAWKTKTIAGIPCINVGVDVWDYYPVSFNQLQGCM